MNNSIVARISLKWFMAVASALYGVLSPIASSGDEPTHFRAQIEKQRDWVAEVDRQDYFFWKRFLYRFDNPGEFPNPPGWYNPGTLIIGAPSAPIATRPATERRLKPSTIETLDAYLRQQRTGMLYVMHKGAIEYEYFDFGTSSGDLLPIRSITKSIISLVAGIALAEGAIKHLDEPIRTYLPEWTDDSRGDITVRQVLHMATGLEYVALELEPTNKAVQLAEGSDVNKAALAYQKTGPVNAEFTINQADSQILTLVLERATGKNLSDYISAKLWRPMGLSTATLNVDAAGNVRGFCCMRMQAMDMLKIGKMLIDKGVWQGQRILPEAWIEESLKPSPANPHVGFNVYRGWDPGTPNPNEQYRPYQAPMRVKGSYFLQGGLSIILWMIPSEDLVIFRWGYDVFETWDMSRIPNLILDDLAGGP